MVRAKDIPKLREAIKMRRFLEDFAEEPFQVELIDFHGNVLTKAERGKVVNRYSEGKRISRVLAYLLRNQRIKLPENESGYLKLQSCVQDKDFMKKVYEFYHCLNGLPEELYG